MVNTMMHTSLSFWTQSNQQAFDEYRQAEQVYALIPNETACVAVGCGWDPVAQAGVNIECAVCDGVGKVVTWVNYAINCRLMWTSMLKYAYPFPTSGTELGDCVITVAHEFVGVLDAVMNSERAYIIANDKTVRPFTKQQQNIPGIVSEYEYTCRLYTPAVT